MNNIKILQVLSFLKTGGAEKLIVDMVPRYREYGLNVDVLLFDGTETPFKRQLESAIGEDKSLLSKFLSWLYFTNRKLRGIK